MMVDEEEATGMSSKLTRVCSSGVAMSCDVSKSPHISHHRTQVILSELTPCKVEFIKQVFP